MLTVALGGKVEGRWSRRAVLALKYGKGREARGRVGGSPLGGCGSFQTRLGAEAAGGAKDRLLAVEVEEEV
ncbi:hypothetical protein Dda_1003 [Drechslerella dactyloides]|uniref:Uncharacterized protein n=1 Tax=Drechslerella dactyloides TaxID=74499 RepID=A0AAD6NNU4_DREDA|nr:hypothetical protein Dda_1003 [Drechslerella dactyloides]